MSFSSFINTVDQPSRHLSITVDTSSDVIDAIADFFDISEVTVQPDKRTAEQPDVVLSEDDIPVISGSIDELYSAVTTTAEVLQTESTAHPDALDIIDQLETTTFHSQNTRQLLVASRYVERQAERAAVGSLYSCFQELSRLKEDLRTRLYYSVLADSGLDVHIFGAPDVSLGDTDRITVHGVDTEEIASAWLVVYDGDGKDERKTAILAEEIAPNQYEGFWTADSNRVDEILVYVSNTYQS